MKQRSMLIGGVVIGVLAAVAVFGGPLLAGHEARKNVITSVERTQASDSPVALKIVDKQVGYLQTRWILEAHVTPSGRTLFSSLTSPGDADNLPSYVSLVEGLRIKLVAHHGLLLDIFGSDSPLGITSVATIADASASNFSKQAKPTFTAEWNVLSPFAAPLQWRFVMQPARADMLTRTFAAHAKLAYVSAHGQIDAHGNRATGQTDGPLLVMSGTRRGDYGVQTTHIEIGEVSFEAESQIPKSADTIYDPGATSRGHMAIKDSSVSFNGQLLAKLGQFESSARAKVTSDAEHTRRYQLGITTHIAKGTILGVGLNDFITKLTCTGLRAKALARWAKKYGGAADHEDGQIQGDALLVRSMDAQTALKFKTALTTTGDQPVTMTVRAGFDNAPWLDTEAPRTTVRIFARRWRKALNIHGRATIAPQLARLGVLLAGGSVSLRQLVQAGLLDITAEQMLSTSVTMRNGRLTINGQPIPEGNT